MSEPTLESTQESQPAPKKKFHINWRGLLTGTLTLIILVALGAFVGYQQAIGDRMNVQSTRIAQDVTEQYALALLDIEAGRYSLAQQRLEYIIQNNPGFPQASQKLAEVMVMSSTTISTSTHLPTSIPTVDLSGAEEIYQRALQAVNSLDWPNALANLDTLRRKDPTYRTAEVDGMYYFSLRNYGYDLITKQGNLEGGIYQLTLAERFGPLDNTASNLREGARLYVLGASFWGLDWKNAVSYFSELYLSFPNMWDGTLTASQRYYQASMRYGDELFAQGQWCPAYEQYQNAAKVGNLDEISAHSAFEAMIKCLPPVLPTETLPAPTP